jgi:hypothetical protein
MSVLKSIGDVCLVAATAGWVAYHMLTGAMLQERTDVQLAATVPPLVCGAVAVVVAQAEAAAQPW